MNTSPEMSGGSFNYLCYRLQRFNVSGNPVLERLFAALIECLRTLEWWYSCDMGPDDVARAIAKYNEVARELPPNLEDTSPQMTIPNMVVKSQEDVDPELVELIDDLDRVIGLDIGYDDGVCTGDQLLMVAPSPHLVAGCTCHTRPVHQGKCVCGLMRPAFDISTIAVRNYIYVIHRKTTFFAREARKWRVMIVAAIRRAMGYESMRVDTRFTNAPIPTDILLGEAFVKALKDHEEKYAAVADAMAYLYDVYLSECDKLQQSVRVGYFQ